jgi:hypothetical protein
MEQKHKFSTEELEKGRLEFAQQVKLINATVAAFSAATKNDKNALPFLKSIGVVEEAGVEKIPS